MPCVVALAPGATESAPLLPLLVVSVAAAGDVGGRPGDAAAEVADRAAAGDIDFGKRGGFARQIRRDAHAAAEHDTACSRNCSPLIRTGSAPASPDDPVAEHGSAERRRSEIDLDPPRAAVGDAVGGRRADRPGRGADFPVSESVPVVAAVPIVPMNVWLMVRLLSVTPTYPPAPMLASDTPGMAWM